MQGVKMPTKADGNCFFHAAFGNNIAGQYITPNACRMRQEWYNFLSQFKSLQDPRMSKALKDQLNKIFNLFLEDPSVLTSRSEAIKTLAYETKQNIKNAETKVEQLKNDIADKFQNDSGFRSKIYLIIQETNNKEKKPPTIQELLDDKGRLLIEISNDLEKYALEFKPELSAEEYKQQYNSQIISDVFLENPDIYSNYLAAIKNSIYYVFFAEIPIIVSLANIEITVHYNDGRSAIFKPNQKLVGSYKSDSSIWGTISKVVISHEGMHFSHVNPDQQEGINRQSNGNNETIITKSTTTNIQTYTFESSTKEKSNTRKSSSDTTNVVASIKQDDVFHQNNEYCFPRCEYKFRFKDTSAFSMLEPNYWNTYFRSTSQGGNSDRIAALVKRNKTYKNSNINKLSDKQHIAPAKSGCITSPWVHLKYKAILYSQPFSPKEVNQNNDTCLYDQLLQYKLSICSIVVSRFVGLSIPDRKIDVYCVNDYPCIMVQIKDLAVLLDSQKEQESLYKIVMSYFTAITNSIANNCNIPIELVNRASFGHNIPSVSDTAKSFRINIGVVPKAYATKVLAPSLQSLNNKFLVPLLNKDPGTTFKLGFSQEEIDKHKQKVTAYNNNKCCIKSRVSSVASWDQDDSLFKVLCKSGDSRGTKVSFQITRKTEYVDLLTDYVLHYLRNSNTQDFAQPLRDILKKLCYKARVTLAVHERDYTDTKYKFHNEENPEIKDDQTFWGIIKNISSIFILGTNNLSNNINSKRINGLYSRLEKANLEFIRNSNNQQAEDGYGSSSDCEVTVDYTKFYSRKITVATGMRAINLVHFLSIFQAGAQHVNTDYMYYETAEVVKKLVQDLQQLRNLDLDTKSGIVQYIDLNHCAASGDNAKVDLQKINNTLRSVAVIVLDYTSATTDKISEAIRLFIKKAPIILLVSSGIKNEQVGADMNPYGTLRIIATDYNDLNKLYYILKTNLVTQEKLPQELHNIRKSYKNAGAVVTSAAIYTKARGYDYQLRTDNDDSNLKDFSENCPTLPDRLKKIAVLFSSAYEEEYSNLTQTHKMSFNLIIEWDLEKITFLGSDDIIDVIEKFNDPDIFQQIEDLYDDNENLAHDIVATIIASKEEITTDIDFNFLKEEYVNIVQDMDMDMDMHMNVCDDNIIDIILRKENYDPEYARLGFAMAKSAGYLSGHSTPRSSDLDDDRMSLDGDISNMSSSNNNSSLGSDEDSSSVGSASDDKSIASLGECNDYE